METTEKEITDFLEKGITERFKRVVQTTSPILLYGSKEDVSIFAPEYAITHLKNNYNRFMKAPLTGGINYFMGYEVKTGYENKVILAHKNAPLYPHNKDMINEVSL